LKKNIVKLQKTDYRKVKARHIRIVCAWKPLARQQKALRRLGLQKTATLAMQAAGLRAFVRTDFSPISPAHLGRGSMLRIALLPAPNVAYIRQAMILSIPYWDLLLYFITA
jgi:hypothetical protein